MVVDRLNRLVRRSSNSLRDSRLSYGYFLLPCRFYHRCHAYGMWPHRRPIVGVPWTRPRNCFTENSDINDQVTPGQTFPLTAINAILGSSSQVSHMDARDGDVREEHATNEQAEYVPNRSTCRLLIGYAIFKRSRPPERFKMTRFRLLTILLPLGFAIAKAVYSFMGYSTLPTTFDLVSGGILVTV
jgi:hypothetical protein